MKRWRQLAVGDHVVARDAFGRWRDAEVCPVPPEWRDGSFSHATTTRGDFPKAWLRFDGEPIPWPVSDIEWPNHQPTTEIPDDEVR